MTQDTVYVKLNYLYYFKAFIEKVHQFDYDKNISLMIADLSTISELF